MTVSSRQLPLPLKCDERFLFVEGRVRPNVLRHMDVAVALTTEVTGPVVAKVPELSTAVPAALSSLLLKRIVVCCCAQLRGTRSCGYLAPGGA